MWLYLSLPHSVSSSQPFPTDGFDVREWRKVYSSIIASEKLGDVSDAAFRLYMLLIVAQDDEGKYPWTPTKVRALTVGCNWDSDGADAALSELRRGVLAELRDGFVWVVNGAKFNGTPSNSKQWPLIYEKQAVMHDAAPTRNSESTDAAPPPTRARVEKSREEKNTPSGTDEPSLPASLKGWQALVRESTNPASTLTHMARTLGEDDPQINDGVALLSQAKKDRNLAAKLLWDAAGATPAGSLLRYAMAIKSGARASPHPAPRRTGTDGVDQLADFPGLAYEFEETR